MDKFDYLYQTAADNNWRIDKFEICNMKVYLELYTSEYSEESDLANEDYIQWQYFKNPAGSVFMSCAKVDQKIVGLYSMIPVKLMIDKNVCIGALSLNTLTHKDFRGKKIFITLAEYTYQKAFSDSQINFVIGFPNENSFPGFLKKLNFSTIGTVPVLFKVNRLGDIINKKNKFSLKSFLNLIGKLPFVRCKHKEVEGVSIVRINKSDNQFDLFWENNKDSYRNAVIRNCEYFQWRYFENPIRDYIFLTAFDNNNKIIGYIVGRVIFQKGIKIGVIGDLFADQNNEIIAKMLIKSIEKHFNSISVEAVLTIMFPHCLNYKFLKKCGFVKLPDFLKLKEFPVIFRSFSNHIHRDQDPKDWYLTLSDNDVF